MNWPCFSAQGFQHAKTISRISYAPRKQCCTQMNAEPKWTELFTYYSSLWLCILKIGYLEKVVSARKRLNSPAEFIQDMTFLTERLKRMWVPSTLSFKSIYSIGKCHIFLLRNEYIWYCVTLLVLLEFLLS